MKSLNINRLLTLALLLSIASFTSIHAQEVSSHLYCAHENSDLQAQYEVTASPRLGSYGTYWTLVVFADFRDDTWSDPHSQDGRWMRYKR